jgi:uncharacterized phage infection (PIP) family protein YhgE
VDDADQLHSTLALVARGVQRMADSFGAIEQRLDRLEAAVGGTDPAGDEQVRRLVEAVRGLRDDLAIATTQLEAKIVEHQPVVDATPASEPAAVEVDRLVDAVRALRDDLAAATTQLQSETTATVERSANEHGARLAQLRDAIIEMRDAIAIDLAAPAAPPVAAPADDEVRALVAEVRDALQAVHGEIVAGSGQLRTDLAAEQATLRDRLVEAVTGLPASPHAAAELVARFEAIDAALASIRADIAAATAPIDAEDPLEPRLIAIESAVTHLRDDFAIDRLELSLRQMGGELERVSNDTSDLRNDVKRSFDRVLTSITAAEDHVVGEVKAVDQRIGGMADDLRLVRGLRDGLEALASGVDAVRVLASKSATSQQMGELGRDLTSLLAEIESARSQVLAVDQQVSQPGAIDVTPAIQRLEQAVGDDVDELGRRIEQLAAAVEAQQHTADAAPDVSDAIASRLRGLATGARQLGLGISEDLRSRSRKKKSRSR